MAAISMPRGEYFRPPEEETSGVPKNPKTYHRSPCPALNTLANHGYIPRDGKNLTFGGLASAILEVFNLDYKVGYLLALNGRLLCVGLNPFAPYTLADLCVHNAVEHDASLFHRDDALRDADPAFPDEALVEGLVKMSSDGEYVTIDDFGKFRCQRSQDTIDNNPKLNLNLIRRTIIGLEASLVINLFGTDDKISIEHLRSFATHEKIPSDYVRRETTLYQNQLNPVSSQVLAHDLPLKEYVSTQNKSALGYLYGAAAILICFLGVYFALTHREDL